MPTILFVCTANLYRSPIAAAYTERTLRAADPKGSWTISSAGTWTVPGKPAHPSAMRAAAILGLDLRDHRTREVDAEILNAADLIVVMENGHREAIECEFPACRGRVALLGELAHERITQIPDPALNNFEDAESIAIAMAGMISRALVEMTHHAEVNSRKPRPDLAQPGDPSSSPASSPTR